MKKLSIQKLLIVLILTLALFASACSSKEEKFASDIDIDPDSTTFTTPDWVDPASEKSSDIKTDSKDDKTLPALVGETTTGDKVTAESLDPSEPKTFTTEDYILTDDDIEYPFDVSDSYSETDGALSSSKFSVGDDMSDSGKGTDSFIIEPIDPVYPTEAPTEIRARAGLLTAGEWNDNENFDFLMDLIKNGQQDNYKGYFENWNLTPFSRYCVNVTSFDGKNVENATVSLYDGSENILWTGTTNNNGIAYLFYNLSNNNEIPASIKVTYGEDFVETSISDNNQSNDIINITLNSTSTKLNKLDLMFVVDTTGSMGDEITFLQEELKDVITRIKNDNANIPINLSMNFYRDLEDDYVIRNNPFSNDIDEQLSYLAKEYASGGGDYEEAVEMALDDAINNHTWSEDSTKILFLVLDAPPHYRPDILDSLAKTINEASKMGVRIVPIASSGVNKSTEFLLRTFAMTTGGTYTFLTNHSGIGESHIEPTIGSYDVKLLNNLLVEIINSYLQ